MSDKIILIVGKSGCGKTTIVNKMEEEYGAKSIASYTTRPKRKENEYGHIFVNEEEFKALKDIVGYTEYGGNLYCATAQQVEENDLYIINPDGVDFFKKNYKGKKEVIVVYITTDLDNHKDFNNRYERMVARGDSYADASYRAGIDNFEFRNAEEMADIVILNDGESGVDNACYILKRVLEGTLFQNESEECQI